MLLPHQSRRYSADISRAQSITAALLVVLIATLSPGIGHAAYFMPTSLGGSLNYGYGYSRVAESESEQSTVSLNINGGGYFWEPWFLRMGAGVGLGLSGAGSSASAGNTAKSVSGSLDFTLFPQSRFPTNVGFTQSDSRQELQNDTLLRGQESQARRFYLRQSYSSLGGLAIDAWFNRNTSSTNTQPGEAVDRSVGFQMRKRISKNDFQFGGGVFESLPTRSDIKNTNSNLLLSHNYFPSGEVGINSLASYSNSETTGVNIFEFKSTYEQVTSSFYWRPEHRSYFISGSVLVYTVSSAAASSNTVSKGVTTTTNATYQFTKDISVNAGVSVNVSDVDGKQVISVAQSLGTGIGSGAGDQYTIFGFNYGWNAGLGLGASANSTDVTGVESSKKKTGQWSPNASASHTLGRSWNLGRYSSMNLNFNQHAAASKTSGTDAVAKSLSSSVSSGWNNYAFGGSTSANASASHSRSFGQNSPAYVVGSVQLARSQELSRLSSLSGSLSFQASQTQLPGSSATNNTPATQGEERVTKSASAGFSYGHGRFLGIHGLIYNSTLSIPALIKEDGIHSTSAKDWNNTLVYRIGLLALNLTVYASESGPGQRAYSMTFGAVRSF